MWRFAENGTCSQREGMEGLSPLPILCPVLHTLPCVPSDCSESHISFYNKPAISEIACFSELFCFSGVQSSWFLVPISAYILASFWCFWLSPMYGLSAWPISSTFFKTYFYLFLAALGLRCCMGFSLAAVSGGYFLVAACGLLIAACGLLIAAASLDAEHRL